MKSLISLVAIFSCFPLGFSHPGEQHSHEEVRRELAKRDAHAANIQRGLTACANNPAFRALKERSETRRYEKAQELRDKRSLDMQSKLPFLLNLRLTRLKSF